MCLNLLTKIVSVYTNCKAKYLAISVVFLLSTLIAYGPAKHKRIGSSFLDLKTRNPTQGQKIDLTHPQ